MTANKFTVEGTSPDGEHYREVFNSYYLAVLCKSELLKKGYDVQLRDPDTIWIHKESTHYNQRERKTFKKFKRAHNNAMAKYRPLRTNYKDAVGERK